MQKIYHVDLTASEREELEGVVKSRVSSSPVVKRAYVLLAADRKGSKPEKDDVISKQYHVRRQTVEGIRKRFVNEGFKEVLYGKEVKYNRDKVLDGDVEAHLIALRCSDPPAGRSSWTLRLLSDKMVELEYVPQISHESVRQLLKKTKLSLGK